MKPFARSERPDGVKRTDVVWTSTLSPLSSVEPDTVSFLAYVPRLRQRSGDTGRNPPIEFFSQTPNRRDVMRRRSIALDDATSPNPKKMVGVSLSPRGAYGECAWPTRGGPMRRGISSVALFSWFLLIVRDRRWSHDGARRGGCSWVYIFRHARWTTLGLHVVEIACEICHFHFGDKCTTCPDRVTRHA